MEFIGKLASNDTSKVGILHSDSKYIYIKLLNRYLHIINNKWNQSSHQNS